MQTITTDELRKRMDAGEQPNLLDVREDYERADFNIGGRHVPIGKLQSMQLDDIEDWKNDEIIIYCRSGNRSGIAANMLEMLGYKNVKNLVGGMLDWQKK
ncbi:rhodanese-like domain-containing protein [Ilyomonas limi]|uniref:Rhodanese-like domain-containing protein n=1 Tax=Ilyomonas limi TaxID=2575867 RepID=A0A4U3KTM5_9BACT|nr:rhodanese-like domain-containing protein [Ilyomonas limi]TKK65711.1 rhodanese-like domain-containing protein [Ilyomonas limi]